MGVKWLSVLRVSTRLSQRLIAFFSRSAFFGISSVSNSAYH